MLHRPLLNHTTTPLARASWLDSQLLQLLKHSPITPLLYHTTTPAQVLAGRFMLDGQLLQLPVRESDPLGVKVEALRMHLEEMLGTDAFVK